MSVKNEGGVSLLPTDARGYALGIYVRLFPLTGSTIYTDNTKRHQPGSCVLRFDLVLNPASGQTFDSVRECFGLVSGSELVFG